jgi:hypothetical protein
MCKQRYGCIRTDTVSLEIILLMGTTAIRFQHYNMQQKISSLMGSQPLYYCFESRAASRANVLHEYRFRQSSMQLLCTSSKKPAQRIISNTTQGATFLHD